MISTFQRIQARLQGAQTTRTAGKTLSDPLKSANGSDFYKMVFKYEMERTVTCWFKE